MNIGGLTIEMAADLARLRQDMDDAKRSVSSAMADIQKAVDIAKTAFVALAGIGSVAAFAGMIRGSIDATAALHDLSIQTGASVAALGAFKSVGSYTETSAESIAGAMNKLAKNMAMADEDSKGAAVAIKALGLNFDDFKKLKPEDQMLVAAKAMNQFEDGADKTAAAMLLFGKEGAKLLPFLKDLGDEADTISAKLTDQEKALKANQAAMADAFGDNLTKIRKDSEAWKKDIATGMLPALYEASQAFVDVANGAGGLKEYISQLAKDGTITEWARAGVTAITYIADAFQYTWRVVETIGKSIGVFFARLATEIGAVGEAAKQAATGDFSGAAESINRGFAQSQQMAVDFREETSRAFSEATWGAKMRDRMAELRNVGAAGTEAKQKLANLKDVVDQTKASQEAAAKAAKEHEAELKRQQQASDAASKALQSFSEAVEAKNDQLRQELALGRDLTPVEKELLKLDQELEKAKRVMTDAAYKAALGKAEETRQAIQAGKALEDEVSWARAVRKEKEEAIAQTDKVIKSVNEEAARQREANEAIGLSKEALLDRKVARYLDLAAQAEAIARTEEEAKGCTALSAQQRELAEAYRKAAAEASTGAHLEAAKAARDEWQKTIDSVGQGLTDSLYRAFESGKGFFETLWSGIKNTFKATVLKVAVQAVMSPINQGLGALMGAGNPLGGLAGMGSFGDLGSLLSGGWNSLTGLPQSMGLNFVNGGLGQYLGLSSFQDIGGNLVAGPTAAGSSLLNGFSYAGDALGYLGALKAASQGKWGSAIGSGVGTFFGGPIGGAIGSTVGGWVDKAFGGDGHDFHGADYVATATGGYRPREYEVGDRQYGWSITGARSADLEKALQGMTDTSLASLNGLSKLFGGAANFKLGTYFSSNETTRNSQGNIRLWQGGSVVSQLSSQRYATDPTKGFEEYSQDVVAAVKSVMKSIQLPEWARKQIDALGTGATVDQLAKTVQAIEQTKVALQGMGSAFAPLGGVFARIGGLSDEAKIQLAGFAGGIDALIAKTRGYVDAYYSDAEKNAISAAAIQKQLAAAGVTANLRSKDDLRRLIDGADVSTEAGRKQLAALLDIASAFAPLGDYLKQQGQSLNELAGQAPQVAALQALTEQQAASQRSQLDATLQLNGSVLSIGDQIAGGISKLGENLAKRLAAVEAAVIKSGRYVGDRMMEV